MRLYSITLYLWPIILYDPFMNELVQFDQNFDFKIRRDYEKISYEHRAYESVDDRSLS